MTATKKLLSTVRPKKAEKIEKFFGSRKKKPRIQDHFNVIKRYSNDATLNAHSGHITGVIICALWCRKTATAGTSEATPADTATSTVPNHNNKSQKLERLLSRKGQASAWLGIMRGPQKPPLCSGHKLPSVARTVLKEVVMSCF